MVLSQQHNCPRRLHVEHGWRVLHAMPHGADELIVANRTLAVDLRFRLCLSATSTPSPRIVTSALLWLPALRRPWSMYETSACMD